MQFCPSLANEINIEIDVWEPDGRRIFREEAERRGIDLRVLRGRSRAIPMVQARQRAIYRMATETGLTLGQIGMVVNRDHTTVGAAIVKYCRTTGTPFPRGLTDRSYRHKLTLR